MIEQEVAKRWYILCTLKDMNDEDMSLFFRDCLLNDVNPDLVWEKMTVLRGAWMEDLNLGFIDDEVEEGE